MCAFNQSVSRLDDSETSVFRHTLRWLTHTYIFPPSGMWDWDSAGSQGQHRHVSRIFSREGAGGRSLTWRSPEQIQNWRKCRHVWAQEGASRILEFLSSKSDLQISEGYRRGQKCMFRASRDPDLLAACPQLTWNWQDSWPPDTRSSRLVTLLKPSHRISLWYIM